LIGKAASGARFAALHKGSIMALVVVRTCDLGEALGRREASASSQRAAAPPEIHTFTLTSSLRAICA
jgi:hypothetical protein